MRISIVSQALQIITKRSGGLIAAGGIFFEGALYDAFQFGRHIMIQLARRLRGAIQDCVKD